MFERYTEKARRIIFFARYEASQTGSAYIEPGHLLLGLIREDKPFATKVLKVGLPESDELHAQLMMPGAEKGSTSVDLPLSHPAKRALAYAAEEAERLNHKHIGTEHLAIGLLREDDVIAARLLKIHGVDLESLRHTAEVQSTDETASKEQPHFLKRPRAPFDFTREGDFQDGRFSTTTTKEGVRTVRSHNFVHGHEIRVIERMHFSEDGKSLHYSIEIQGPGQEHRHEIDFPI